MSKVLDAVEAAASCAKAEAERPASAATDPFDDFETASSSGSNSLLAAESFDRQMSDAVDRSLEESRVRYLNMAFTTIAKVPYCTLLRYLEYPYTKYLISSRVLFLREKPIALPLKHLCDCPFKTVGYWSIFIPILFSGHFPFM